MTGATPWEREKMWTDLPPTPMEALAFWHASMGLSGPGVAKKLKCTKGAASEAVKRARAKARKQGLCYIYIKPPEPPPPTMASGMTYLKQLALEAGLYEK